jgi:ABC-2 type transport system ATP-binding protein
VSSAALFEAKDLRIDVGGVPAIDGLALTCAPASVRVLVLGGARALFEAASGMRHPSRGDVLVRGETAGAAVVASRVAGAPLDPPLPPRWTARAYATWSARLSGRGAKEAQRWAANAIERLKMAKMADEPLRTAPPHGKRAAVIAAAIATGSPVIFLEDPLAGLADTVARSFGRILVEALADRAWAVFAPRVSIASAIALAADEALLVEGSSVTAQGAPAELAARTRTYALKVHGAPDDFAHAAEARGAVVTRGPSRLLVDLGASLGTRDLLAMAIETRTVIVEMSPLARTLE